MPNSCETLLFNSYAGSLLVWRNSGRKMRSCLLPDATKFPQVGARAEGVAFIVCKRNGVHVHRGGSILRPMLKLFRVRGYVFY